MVTKSNTLSISMLTYASEVSLFHWIKAVQRLENSSSFFDVVLQLSFVNATQAELIYIRYLVFVFSVLGYFKMKKMFEFVRLRSGFGSFSKISLSFFCYFRTHQQQTYESCVKSIVRNRNTLNIHTQAMNKNVKTYCCSFKFCFCHK